MCYSSNNNPGKILIYKIPFVGNTHPFFFSKVLENYLLNFCLGSIHISGRQVGRRYVAYSGDKPVITYLQFFPDDGEYYPGVCYCAVEVTLFLKALGRLHRWALRCPFAHSVMRVWTWKWYLKGIHDKVLCCVSWAEQSLILTYLQKVLDQSAVQNRCLILFLKELKRPLDLIKIVEYLLQM